MIITSGLTEDTGMQVAVIILCIAVFTLIIIVFTMNKSFKITKEKIQELQRFQSAKPDANYGARGAMYEEPED